MYDSFLHSFVGALCLGVVFSVVSAFMTDREHSDIRANWFALALVLAIILGVLFIYIAFYVYLF